MSVFSPQSGRASLRFASRSFLRRPLKRSFAWSIILGSALVALVSVIGSVVTGIVA